jgi:ppGpp synthetase/RelA/SpoT-type nucleotidyltranferase
VIIPVEVQNWYSENRSRLELVERKAKPALDHFTASRGYLYSGRIKTLESVVEKIDTGRVASWSKLDDAFAALIVVPTYSHEPAVRDFLESAFYVEDTRERGATSKPAEQFRFDATRVYCRLTSPSASADLYDQILFEVQILSAFDYAWQKVTHDLVYKHATIEWRRLRAAAQIKAVVEQLDAIAENFDAFVTAIAPSEWAETSAQTTIVRHIDELFKRGSLPSELIPAAPSRLAQTVLSYLQNDGCRREEMRDRVARALHDIDTYLSGKTPSNVPLSLTLAQLLFGIMYQSGAISTKVRQRILLNGPMLLEFPELRGYGNVFAT